jgi:hypothetical protein
MRTLENRNQKTPQRPKPAYDRRQDHGTRGTQEGHLERSYNREYAKHRRAQLGRRALALDMDTSLGDVRSNSTTTADASETPATA